MTLIPEEITIPISSFVRNYIYSCFCVLFCLSEERHTVCFLDNRRKAYIDKRKKLHHILWATNVASLRLL